MFFTICSSVICPEMTKIELLMISRKSLNYGQTYFAKW